MSKKLIYGVGINDADYKVTQTVDGKATKCPFYSAWHSMLKRCYDPIEHKNYPNYIGCEVYEDWKYLSKFKLWMEGQDWEGKQLDKDLLVKGNKLYSPDTCCFLDSRINGFLTERQVSRGENALIGASIHKASGKYRAYCNDPFTNKWEYLGLHVEQQVAHLAWKARKHYHALRLAEYEVDQRIKEALENRYAL